MTIQPPSQLNLPEINPEDQGLTSIATAPSPSMARMSISIRAAGRVDLARR